MPDFESRLAQLGLKLPDPAKPVANYIPAVRTGNLVFLSGQVPLRNGQLIKAGTVPGAVSIEEARECARQCVLNALAALKAEIGSLDRVRRFVKVGVFVACEHGFSDQPKVGNGASDLLAEIFGEAGKHARAAVGVPALPLNAPVEVDFVVEVT